MVGWTDRCLLDRPASRICPSIHQCSPSRLSRAGLIPVTVRFAGNRHHLTSGHHFAWFALGLCPSSFHHPLGFVDRPGCDVAVGAAALDQRHPAGLHSWPLHLSWATVRGQADQFDNGHCACAGVYCCALLYCFRQVGVSRSRSRHAGHGVDHGTHPTVHLPPRGASAGCTRNSAGMVLVWLRAFGEYGAVVVLAYHPFSLPVYTYNQFSGIGLPTTLAPTALALSVAAVVVGIGRAVPQHRGVRPALVPAPDPPNPIRSTPATFEIDYRLGTFHLHLSKKSTANNLAIVGPSGSGKSAILAHGGRAQWPERGVNLVRRSSDGPNGGE